MPPVDTDRLNRIATARNAWTRSLMESSRGRNPLLMFRPLKAGTLDLPRQSLGPLLRGKTMSVANLFSPDQRSNALTRLRTIAKEAVTNRDDRAIETLYLALSMATWDPGAGKATPQAPIVLLPIGVELLARGTEARLTCRGPLRVNIALLHVLETRFHCDVASLRDLDETEFVDAGPIAEQIITLLTQTAQEVPGFAVQPAAVLGNFAFQQLQLITELATHGNLLARHDVVAALAGDVKAADSLRIRNVAHHPEDIADPATWQRFLIRDADSSQLQVIAAALVGQSGVVQGPPGTGKSQVIANTIAVLSAHGRRVLFVAEKRAALDVVKERLHTAGLGHMLLDFHDPRLTRKSVVEQLSHAVLAVDQHRNADGQMAEQAYQQLHGHLARHVQALHMQRQPSGMSAYDLLGQLLRTPGELYAATRWRNPELASLTATKAARIETALVEAGGFGDLFLGRYPSAWTSARLTTGEAVDDAWDKVDLLNRVHLPRLRDAAKRAAAAAGLPAPQTIDQILLLVDIMPRIARTLERYDRTLFDEDLDRLARVLAPTGTGALQALWAFVVDPEVRQAYGAGRSYYRAGRFIWPWDLERDLARAAKRQNLWHEAQGESAIVPSREQILAAHAILKDSGAGDALATLEDLAAYFPSTAINRWLGTIDPALASIDSINAFVIRLRSDTDTPDRLPRMLALRTALGRAGLGPLIRELATRHSPSEQWPGIFAHAWTRSCLDDVVRIESGIRGFNGQAHTMMVDRFAKLDVQRIARGPAEVRAAHAIHARAILAKYRQQDSLIRREVNKRSRYRPLRQLLEMAPDALTALCPCWMGSPLSVSQFTPADRQLFDVVIFDEASQVVPEVAVAALLRGASVIVAGDRNQLPPTAFFVAGVGDELDTNEADERFESLLEAVATFLPTWSLDWHYRSQDESLIGFANQQIYDGRLVTFPDAGAGEPAVQHILASSYEDEVARVVTLIVDHLTNRPNESLGVIAFGQEHAAALERAVAMMLQEHPDLETFFAESQPERVFIRNLERVQGDERDAVILSVGYSKRADGKLALQFGPLNKVGGERRLNVAITRARRRMIVVSSFTAGDMEHGRSAARGVRMLRDFLGYAAGGEIQRSHHEAGGKLDAFEHDVFEALVEIGLPVVAHYGMSAIPLTFAVQHPTDPGRFVLAIECDGPVYRDTPTARDRERLRPEQLRRRGWRYYRLWSLDWFTNRDQEIRRIVEAYEEALRSSAVEVVSLP